MKTLYESLLDDFEDLSAPLSPKAIKAEIKRFLKVNYKNPSRFRISHKPNDDGYYVVECSDKIIFSGQAESLTNGKFIFDKCSSFSIQSAHRLKNLIGSPKEVKFSYHVSNCNGLESLEGITEKTGFGYGIHITDCYKLKTLEGLPKKVHYLNIAHCHGLTDLTGAPEEIELDFKIWGCYDLDSLKGAPKKVGGEFVCSWCKGGFSIDDMKAVTKASKYDTVA